MSALVEQIDALLPQTQCTRCGYPDCRRYAEAIAKGDADINQCPPGGVATMQALAALAGSHEQPIDPARGVMPASPEVARIDEANCIGCYKCVQVCPTDAIIGAPKWMHTVIASDCSGCELCLPVCPTDCIVMVTRAPSLPAPAALAPRWRSRYGRHLERRSRERREREAARKAKTGTGLKEKAEAFDLDAAIARASRRNPPDPGKA